MKDDRLEKEFDEYFKGVNTPDDITRDAKKYVKPKQQFMPKFVKFASIAASFVLVFAVALTVILKTNFNKANNGANSGDSNSSAVTPPDDCDDVQNNKFALYTDAELKQKDADAYSLSSLNANLAFIENFAIASNASVESCKAGYKDGRLALVKADVSIICGLKRDRTKIYVEFTESKTVHSDVADYYDGKIQSYYGTQYYITEAVAENGEPQFKLHVSYRGVKYYFNVLSSDKKAYEKYLDMVIAKNI